ncbi:hypothetical protein BDV12DRAFT_182564 [Aspergillus spectabilis]
MFKKIMTVVGASGIQGGSVVTALPNNPAYSIRAITRNPQSDAAKALIDNGVEVVQADINSVNSLRSAFTGSHALFAVTNFESLFRLGITKSMDTETTQEVNLADVAAATDFLEHYVWSTLPNTKQNSNGRAVVPYFESKNRTTFLWIGWYASNIPLPTQHLTRIRMFDGNLKSSLHEMLAWFVVVHGIEAHCRQIAKDEYVKLWPVANEAGDISHRYFEIDGKGFSSVVEEVLTKEDLNVKGLVVTAEAFKSVPLLD